MKRLLLFGLLSAVLGCGQGASDAGEGALGFDLYVSRAVLDELGAFQIAVVKNGSGYDCLELAKTCLVAQPAASDAVELDDGKKALLFSAALADGETTRTQDVELRGIPVGRDYLLVIEALSRREPPTLLGSSCTRIDEIRQGNNGRVLANPIRLPTTGDGETTDGGEVPGSCDPRFER